MSGGGSDSGGRGSGGSTRSVVEASGGNWCTAVLIRSLLYIKKHHINQRSDPSFLPVWQCVLSLCLCASSRGAAWPRSPWWRRPGWSRASSWCSPSSACSSSWWRWRCPLPSSAYASAPTSAWRRSWPAWGLTPVLMPPQPIRLVQPPPPSLWANQGPRHLAWALLLDDHTFCSDMRDFLIGLWECLLMFELFSSSCFCVGFWLMRPISFILSIDLLFGPFIEYQKSCFCEKPHSYALYLLHFMLQ